MIRAVIFLVTLTVLVNAKDIDSLVKAGNVTFKDYLAMVQAPNDSDLTLILKFCGKESQGNIYHHASMLGLYNIGTRKSIRALAGCIRNDNYDFDATMGYLIYWKVKPKIRDKFILDCTLLSDPGPMGIQQSGDTVYLANTSQEKQYLLTNRRGISIYNHYVFKDTSGHYNTTGRYKRYDTTLINYTEEADFTCREIVFKTLIPGGSYRVTTAREVKDSPVVYYVYYLEDASDTTHYICNWQGYRIKRFVAGPFTLK